MFIRLSYAITVSAILMLAGILLRPEDHECTWTGRVDRGEFADILSVFQCMLNEVRAFRNLGFYHVVHCYPVVS